MQTLMLNLFDIIMRICHIAVVSLPLAINSFLSFINKTTSNSHFTWKRLHFYDHSMHSNRNINKARGKKERYLIIVINIE